MKKIIIAFTVAAISIASCSKTSTPTASKSNTPDGAVVFATNCAHCHGAKGIKDSRTPNLQTIALEKSDLVSSITRGKGHMPAWGGKISPAEISAVADLIVRWHNK